MTAKEFVQAQGVKRILDRLRCHLCDSRPAAERWLLETKAGLLRVEICEQCGKDLGRELT